MLRGSADELGDICFRAQVRLLEVPEARRGAKVRLDVLAREPRLAAPHTGALGPGLDPATTSDLR